MQLNPYLIKLSDLPAIASRLRLGPNAADYIKRNAKRHIDGARIVFHMTDDEAKVITATGLLVQGEQA